MEIKQIDSNYYVSAQILARELAAIKSAGICSVICNRPDGESADQPTYAEIEHKAKQLGLHFRYIPIDKGTIGDEQVHQFKQALNELPSPILGFCRSGMRSATLWSFANATTLSLDEIIDKTTVAGYDMTAMTKRILNGGKALVDND